MSNDPLPQVRDEPHNPHPPDVMPQQSRPVRIFAIVVLVVIGLSILVWVIGMLTGTEPVTPQQSAPASGL